MRPCSELRPCKYAFVALIFIQCNVEFYFLLNKQRAYVHSFVLEFETFAKFRSQAAVFVRNQSFYQIFCLTLGTAEMHTFFRWFFHWGKQNFPINQSYKNVHCYNRRYYFRVYTIAVMKESLGT